MGTTGSQSGRSGQSKRSAAEVQTELDQVRATGDQARVSELESELRQAKQREGSQQ